MPLCRHRVAPPIAATLTGRRHRPPARPDHADTAARQPPRSPVHRRCNTDPHPPTPELRIDHRILLDDHGAVCAARLAISRPHGRTPTMRVTTTATSRACDDARASEHGVAPTVLGEPIGKGCTSHLLPTLSHQGPGSEQHKDNGSERISSEPPRQEDQRRTTGVCPLSDPARLAILDTLSLGDASPSERQTILGMHSNLLAPPPQGSRDRGDAGAYPVRGRPAAHLPAARARRAGRHRARTATAAARIVFVCTANSARSQLAAALWRRVSVARAEPAQRGGRDVERVGRRRAQVELRRRARGRDERAVGSWDRVDLDRPHGRPSRMPMVRSASLVHGRNGSLMRLVSSAIWL